MGTAAVLESMGQTTLLLLVYYVVGALSSASLMADRRPTLALRRLRSEASRLQRVVGRTLRLESPRSRNALPEHNPI